MYTASLRYTYDMLYTRKGDNGTTQFFGNKERFSKAIVLPYLHGLFESFTKSANSGIRGIPRLTLNKVSERSHAFLSFWTFQESFAIGSFHSFRRIRTDTFLKLSSHQLRASCWARVLKKMSKLFSRSTTSITTTWYLRMISRSSCLRSRCGKFWRKGRTKEEKRGLLPKAGADCMIRCGLRCE